jgi:malate dehydrogenase (oxaloacetate-decarboxylating)(NADP+)
VDNSLMREHADFARKDYSGPPIKDLVDVVRYVKPTALLGLSAVKARPSLASLILL